MDNGNLVTEPLLKLQDLEIGFPGEGGWNRVLQGVSWKLEAGKTLGIVGESGSGKSITALSIMGLVGKPGKITQGKIGFTSPTFGKVDLANLPQHQFRSIRGNEIGMIFQEPMSALNPVMRCGVQAAEGLRIHKNLSRKAALAHIASIFDQVGLPAKTLNAYPHEISGGQKQRVMIAMAISCDPHLLIADEPTTALDVTIQAKILELLRELQRDRGLSMLFITHDLGVVAEIADEVLVMRKGAIVEEAPIEQLFSQPQHPYSKGLLACRPNMEQSFHRLPTIDTWEEEKGKKKGDPTGREEAFSPNLKHEPKPILEAKNLSKWFSVAGQKNAPVVKAVAGVSFSLFPGETLGLVGESGCGKTTLGRSLLRLIEPSEGVVLFKGKNILELDSPSLRNLRKKIQIIFQDPFSSLNPRLRIGRAIQEAMRVQGIGTSSLHRKQLIEALLERVGLEQIHYRRYPHEFSGGQRQRVCIARALALEPELIVCDESVSALDVSVQAQVLNLLKDLQEERNLAYLFISHDMSVVKHMSDRVMVMKDGKLVELDTAEVIYHTPTSDYTRSLIQAIPKGTLERIKALQEAKHISGK